MSGTPHTKVQENRKRRNWLPFVVTARRADRAPR
jgi:hypothetical protein